MLVGNMALPLMKETIWFDKYRFDEAERLYEETKARQGSSSGSGDCSSFQQKKDPSSAKGSTIAEEIAKTRQRIQNSLKNANLKTDGGDEGAASINQRVQQLESMMEEVKAQVDEMSAFMKAAVDKIKSFEQLLKQPHSVSTTTAAAPAPPSVKAAAKPAQDDDDIDLFGSEDDEEVNASRAARLKEYETKKAKKGPLVAKSSVVLDVKPWDDETDLKLMEAKVREIQTDGLVWGASKSVPLAFGIHKLQIVAIVEDEKVSIDWLQETIQEIEDLVQSVDIAAFNKL